MNSYHPWSNIRPGQTVRERLWPKTFPSRCHKKVGIIGGSISSSSSSGGGGGGVGSSSSCSFHEISIYYFEDSLL